MLKKPKAKNFLKIVILLFLSSILLSKKVILVYGQESPPSFTSVLQQNDMNLEKWITGNVDVAGTQRGVMDAIIEGLTVKLIGVPTGEVKGANTGALGITSQMMAFLYTSKPASVGRYFAYMGEKLKIVKPVYAQGTGWKAMGPILPFWQAMRNICYLFLIVIFVVIGFMIMFRNKLDPQTAVSIQNSLPRLVMALILITFSYAIAGLLIDIGEIFTGIIVTIFKNPWIPNLQDVIDRLKGQSGFDIKQPWVSVANIFTLMSPLLKATNIIQNSVVVVLKQIPTIGWAFKLPLIGSGIVTLMLAMAIVGAIIKTFFMLVNAYVTIVFLTIFSPFVFLAGGLPGAKTIGAWIKNMLSNVLIFPATFLLITFATILVNDKPLGIPLDSPWGVTAQKVDSFTWNPVPLGIFWQEIPKNAPFDPQTYAQITLFINYLIGFGVILILPKAGEIVRSFMEGKPEVPVGAEVEAGMKGMLRNIPIVGSFLS